MYKLIPLFLLSASVVFGSPIEYTIDFYATYGLTPGSSSFFYDASAPIGSQFTGFDIGWDGATTFLGLDYADSDPETQAELQNFGEALVSNACTSPTWTANFYYSDENGLEGGGFTLECTNSLFVSDYLIAGYFTPLVTETAGGTFTVCEAGTICASPALVPEPGTAWLALLGTVMVLCGLIRRRSSNPSDAAIMSIRVPHGAKPSFWRA